MRILILGAGGVGGYFGGRLADAGMDVTFLVREKRFQQLHDNGLVIESPCGDLVLPVKTIMSGQTMAPPDIIMVACKAYGLTNALSAIAPYVGPGTVIMPVLNGVVHMDVMAKTFPEATLWGGVAHIGVTCLESGVIKHLNDLQGLFFGPMDGRVDDRASELRTFAEKAGINAQLSDDITQSLWEKFVFLTTLAGCTCLFRADIGTILKTANGKNMILGMLDECFAVAKKQGHLPGSDKMETCIEQLTKPGSDMKASMLRDIENRAPSEGGHIVGDMVRRAKSHGLNIPLLTAASVHLDAYQQNRK